MFYISSLPESNYQLSNHIRLLTHSDVALRQHIASDEKSLCPERESARHAYYLLADNRCLPAEVKQWLGRALLTAP